MKKQLVDRSLVQDRVCQNTYTSLKCLLDNCYYGQMVYPQKNTSHDSVEIAYWREFCTVRMCTARQSGHTTAMLKIIKEYFDKAIILSPMSAMSERLNASFRKLQADSEEYVTLTKNEITTANGHYLFGTWMGNSLANRFRGCEAEAIFIDGTFEMSTATEGLIYSLLGPCMSQYPQKFFVFIQ